MEYDRQETGDCTSRVGVPTFKDDQDDHAHQTTTVELMQEAIGDFELAYGVTIVRGRLHVTDARTPASEPGPPNKATTRIATSRSARRKDPKPPIQRLVDEVSSYFVPAVIPSAI